MIQVTWIKIFLKKFKLNIRPKLALLILKNFKTTAIKFYLPNQKLFFQQSQNKLFHHSNQSLAISIKRHCQIPPSTLHSNDTKD